jgi:hypothetical protein
MRREGIGPDLVRQAHRLRGDLEIVRKKLEDSPEELMEHAFPESDVGLRPRAIVGEQDGLESSLVSEFDTATQEQRRRFLEAGARAAERVATEGPEITLEPAEEIGLEAIIRFTARPAILIKNGDFDAPPAPWQGLVEHKQGILRTASSVGRVEVQGLPDVPYGGTGFLVAPDVVMTNCHVARIFCALSDGGKWDFLGGVTASVDFVENPDADAPLEFPVTEVIGIHDRVDLALLRIDPEKGSDGAEPPEPLALASEEPEAPDDGTSRRVLVLGYPAPDSGRNDPTVMRQIFGEVYYVKRLQPGELLDPVGDDLIAGPPCSQNTTLGDVIYHDSSTLGGNSGSCVVDLDSNQVLGLHYAGLYTKYNQGVALWKLVDDPLLTGAGANFD